MEQLLEENNYEWESQVAERRLKLVIEDIEATKKQISSLETQKDKLKNDYGNLEFELDELQSNIETLQSATNYNNDGDSSIDEGDFFTLLTELENEEASLKGEIQSYQNLQKSLAHDRRRFSATNTKLENELALDKQKLETLNSEIRESNDILKDLQLQLDSKSVTLNEIIERCQELQQEETNIADELKKFGEGLITSLKEEEYNEKLELERERGRKKELGEKWENTRRRKENEVNKKASDLQKQNSISNWRHDRSLLLGKLKRAKEQLARQEQSLKNALAKKDKIAQKYRELLGDDPGDGTGLCAKAIVREELNEINTIIKEPEQPKEDDNQQPADENNEKLENTSKLSKAKTNASLSKSKSLKKTTASEITMNQTQSVNKVNYDAYLKNIPPENMGDIEALIRVEKSYNEELKRQKERISASLQIFYQHRDETMDSLNDELYECSQDGYLRLIREELNDLLQNHVAQL